MPDVLLDDQQAAQAFSPPERTRPTVRWGYRPASPSQDGRRLRRNVVPTLDQLRGNNAACYQGHVFNVYRIWRDYVDAQCPQCSAICSNRLASDRYDRLRERRYAADRRVVAADRSQRMRQRTRELVMELGRPLTLEEQRQVQREVRNRTITDINNERIERARMDEFQRLRREQQAHLEALG